MKKILLRIRLVIVIVYDLSTLPAPFIFMFLMTSNGIITWDFIKWGLIAFAYLMPECFHLGMFGDKPKRVADKVMGYSYIQEIVRF